MTKKQFHCLIVALTLIFSGAATFVSAGQSAVLTVNTDGSSLKKLQTGLQGIKESAVNLINAKDEENLSPAEKEQKELELRLEILKKVVALAIQETKDIISQLKNLESKDSKFALQKEQLLKEFENFLTFYEEQKQNLENSETINDLASVRNAAQSLKEWREKIYSPVFEKTTDLLLLRQQKTLLELAEKRHQKISADLKKLKKINSRVFAKTEKSLEQASVALNEARSLEQKAELMFWFSPEAETSSVLTATSTATSSDIFSVPPLATNSSSTKDKTENQNSSIKDLVGQSLNKIKEAYRIFIEMSNSVKKLLI